MDKSAIMQDTLTMHKMKLLVVRATVISSSKKRKFHSLDKTIQKTKPTNNLHYFKLRITQQTIYKTTLINIK